MVDYLSSQLDWAGYQVSTKQGSGPEDLAKIIFDRDGRLPTLISSQSAAAYWVETLPDRVGADSLVSRLNNGHRIHIGDFDMRKATAPTTPDD